MLTLADVSWLATDIIDDRADDIADAGDVKWYAEEIDADWDVQAAVIDAVCARLGLAQ